MSVRGVRQLKRLQLYFCDWGGSSEGVRDALLSEDLVDFVKKNAHLEMEATMRRNKHPYVSATYINGFVRDFPLRMSS